MRLFYCLLVSCSIVFFSSASPLLSARTSSKKMSFTISPIHLLFPIVEVMGEFQMSNKVGVAGIVGIGSVLGISVFELGGQWNYYAIGNFQDGMQLGGELLYLNLADNISDSDRSFSVSASGLSLAPYIGYKTAAGYGLTFNGQLGASFLLVSATAKDDANGAKGSVSTSGTGILLNLNVGWSF